MTTLDQNYRITNAHYQRLINQAQPPLAELTLFFTMMPKGGDIHHHYSGAIYAETYLDWVDRQGFCIYKTSWKIETEPQKIAAEQAKAGADRECISAQALGRDNHLYRDLLQRWSNKDFDNHTTLQVPPDTQFFDTFDYFGPASSYQYNDGLQLLKKRAIAENVQYIETMVKSSPSIATANSDFDARVEQLVMTPDGAALERLLSTLLPLLKSDKVLQQKTQQYIDDTALDSVHIDDEQFAMRYQAYVDRNKSPSIVFSGLYTAFVAASHSNLIVGVNIVGPENGGVAMRDYSVHMQMFKFLKQQFPDVKLALHAGELALGMVPPEGLTHHIADAVNIAGADRIGHGIDIAYESGAPALLKKMRDKSIAVEINLTSNEFILGIKDAMHPVTIYERYGVPFVISTDDPGVSRNNLSSQYVLYASRYKPSYDAIKKLAFNSIQYAFLAPEDKAVQTKILEGRFRQFEAELAGLDKAGIPALAQ
ncbi:adenosine deaminase [Glaciimonas sp. GG7]